MVADLKSPTLNGKATSTPPQNDNNLSMYIARKSTILKFYRLVCLIILRGG